MGVQYPWINFVELKSSNTYASVASTKETWVGSVSVVALFIYNRNLIHLSRGVRAHIFKARALRALARFENLESVRSARAFPARDLNLISNFYFPLTNLEKNILLQVHFIPFHIHLCIRASWKNKTWVRNLYSGVQKLQIHNKCVIVHSFL